MEPDTIDLTDPIKEIIRRSTLTKECLNNQLSNLIKESKKRGRSNENVSLNDLLKNVPYKSWNGKPNESIETIVLSDDDDDDDIRAVNTDNEDNVTEVQVIEISDHSGDESSSSPDDQWSVNEDNITTSPSDCRKLVVNTESPSKNIPQEELIREQIKSTAWMAPMRYPQIEDNAISTEIDVVQSSISNLSNLISKIHERNQITYLPCSLEKVGFESKTLKSSNDVNNETQHSKANEEKTIHDFSPEQTFHSGNKTRGNNTSNNYNISEKKGMKSSSIDTSNPLNESIVENTTKLIASNDTPRTEFNRNYPQPGFLEETNTNKNFINEKVFDEEDFMKSVEEILDSEGISSNTLEEIEETVNSSIYEENSSQLHERALEKTVQINFATQSMESVKIQTGNVDSRKNDHQVVQNAKENANSENVNLILNTSDIYLNSPKTDDIDKNEKLKDLEETCKLGTDAGVDVSVELKENVTSSSSLNDCAEVKPHCIETISIKFCGDEKNLRRHTDEGKMEVDLLKGKVNCYKRYSFEERNLHNQVEENKTSEEKVGKSDMLNMCLTNTASLSETPDDICKNEASADDKTTDEVEDINVNGTLEKVSSRFFLPKNKLKSLEEVEKHDCANEDITEDKNIYESLQSEKPILLSLNKEKNLSVEKKEISQTDRLENVAKCEAAELDGISLSFVHKDSEEPKLGVNTAENCIFKVGNVIPKQPTKRILEKLEPESEIEEINSHVSPKSKKSCLHIEMEVLEKGEKHLENADYPFSDDSFSNIKNGEYKRKSQHIQNYPNEERLECVNIASVENKDEIILLYETSQSQEANVASGCIQRDEPGQETHIKIIGDVDTFGIGEHTKFKGIEGKPACELGKKISSTYQNENIVEFGLEVHHLSSNSDRCKINENILGHPVSEKTEKLEPNFDLSLVCIDKVPKLAPPRKEGDKLEMRCSDSTKFEGSCKVDDVAKFDRTAKKQTSDINAATMKKEVTLAAWPGEKSEHEFKFHHMNHNIDLSHIQTLDQTRETLFDGSVANREILEEVTTNRVPQYQELSKDSLVEKKGKTHFVEKMHSNEVFGSKEHATSGENIEKKRLSILNNEISIAEKKDNQFFSEPEKEALDYAKYELKGNLEFMNKDCTENKNEINICKVSEVAKSILESDLEEVSEKERHPVEIIDYDATIQNQKQILEFKKAGEKLDLPNISLQGENLEHCLQTNHDNRTSVANIDGIELINEEVKLEEDTMFSHGKKGNSDQETLYIENAHNDIALKTEDRATFGEVEIVELESDNVEIDNISNDGVCGKKMETEPETDHVANSNDAVRFQQQRLEYTGSSICKVSEVAKSILESNLEEVSEKERLAVEIIDYDGTKQNQKQILKFKKAGEKLDLPNISLQGKNLKHCLQTNHDSHTSVANIDGIELINEAVQLEEDTMFSHGKKGNSDQETHGIEKAHNDIALKTKDRATFGEVEIVELESDKVEFDNICNDGVCEKKMENEPETDHVANSNDAVRFRQQRLEYTGSYICKVSGVAKSNLESDSEEVSEKERHPVEIIDYNGTIQIQKQISEFEKPEEKLDLPNISSQGKNLKQCLQTNHVSPTSIANVDRIELINEKVQLEEHTMISHGKKGNSDQHCGIENAHNDIAFKTKDHTTFGEVEIVELESDKVEIDNICNDGVCEKNLETEPTTDHVANSNDAVKFRQQSLECTASKQKSGKSDPSTFALVENLEQETHHIDDESKIGGNTMNEKMIENLKNVSDGPEVCENEITDIRDPKKTKLPKKSNLKASLKTNIKSELDTCHVEIPNDAFRMNENILEHDKQHVTVEKPNLVNYAYLKHTDGVGEIYKCTVHQFKDPSLSSPHGEKTEPAWNIEDALESKNHSIFNERVENIDFVENNSVLGDKSGNEMKQDLEFVNGVYVENSDEIRNMIIHQGPHSGKTDVSFHEQDEGSKQKKHVEEDNEILNVTQSKRLFGKQILEELNLDSLHRKNLEPALGTHSFRNDNDNREDTAKHTECVNSTDDDDDVNIHELVTHQLEKLSAQDVKEKPKPEIHYSGNTISNSAPNSQVIIREPVISEKTSQKLEFFDYSSIGSNNNKTESHLCEVKEGSMEEKELQPFTDRSDENNSIVSYENCDRAFASRELNSISSARESLEPVSKLNSFEDICSTSVEEIEKEPSSLLDVSNEGKFVGLKKPIVVSPCRQNSESKHVATYDKVFEIKEKQKKVVLKCVDETCHDNSDIIEDIPINEVTQLEELDFMFPCEENIEPRTDLDKSSDVPKTGEPKLEHNVEETNVIQQFHDDRKLKLQSKLNPLSILKKKPDLESVSNFDEGEKSRHISESDETTTKNIEFIDVKDYHNNKFNPNDEQSDFKLETSGKQMNNLNKPIISASSMDDVMKEELSVNANNIEYEYNDELFEPNNVKHILENNEVTNIASIAEGTIEQCSYDEKITLADKVCETADDVKDIQPGDYGITKTPENISSMYSGNSKFLPEAIQLNDDNATTLENQVMQVPTSENNETTTFNVASCGHICNVEDVEKDHQYESERMKKISIPNEGSRIMSANIETEETGQHIERTIETGVCDSLIELDVECEGQSQRVDDTDPTFDQLEEVRQQLKLQLTTLRTRKKMDIFQNVKQTVVNVDNLQKIFPVTKILGKETDTIAITKLPFQKTIPKSGSSNLELHSVPHEVTDITTHLDGKTAHVQNLDNKDVPDVLSEIRSIIKKAKPSGSSCDVQRYILPLSSNIVGDFRNKQNDGSSTFTNETVHKTDSLSPSNPVVSNPLDDANDVSPQKTFSSPFVSNSLDEFLVDSKLNVSYTIPKSGAEEGLKNHDYSVDPFPSSTKKEETNETDGKQNRTIIYKPKTLAEKRRILEKTKILEEKRLKKQRQQIQNKSYVLFKDKKIFLHSTKLGKCVAAIESTFKPVESTTRKKSSLLSDLYRKCHSSVSYKAGPLSKKHLLQTDGSRWSTEIKKLPKVSVSVMPQFGKPIHPCLLSLFHKWTGEISDHQVEFALTALAAPKSEPKIFKFDLNYENRQERLMVRKKEMNTKIYRASETAYDNINEDVSIVINNLVNYVETKEIADSLIKVDDGFKADFAESRATVPKRKRSKKHSKTSLELLRLNCKLVRMEAKEGEMTNCNEPYCRLGCVCKSLQCETKIGLHCKKITCIFGCSCPKELNKVVSISKPGDATDESSLLSTNTVSRIEDEAKKNLARVEKEFTQTIIYADGKTIVVGVGNKPRRAARLPKKYSDFFDDDGIDNTSKKERQPLVKPCCVSLERWDFSDITPYCLVHCLYNCYCQGLSRFDSVKEEKYENTIIDSCEREQDVLTMESLLGTTCRSAFSSKRQISRYTGRSQRKKKFAVTSDYICYDRYDIESNPISMFEPNYCARTQKIAQKYRSVKTHSVSATLNDFTNHITEEDLIKANLKETDMLDSDRLKKIIIEDRQKQLEIIEKKPNRKRKQQFHVREDDEEMVKTVPTEKQINEINAVFPGEIIVGDPVCVQKLCCSNSKQTSDSYARILPWGALLKGFVSKQINVYCINDMPLRLLLNMGKKIVSHKVLDIETCGNKILEMPLNGKAAWLLNQSENVRDIIRWLLSGSLSSKYRAASLSFLLVETLPGQFEVRGLCTQNQPSKAIEESMLQISDEITEIKHKDMNNEIQSLFITKMNLHYRELVEDGCDDDLTDNLYMWVGLPEVYKVAKWRVIFLKNDFAFLYFKNIKYSIKYSDLVKLAEVAKDEKLTLLIRNLEIRRSHDHMMFGLYVSPTYIDRIFIGPYFLGHEQEDIDTIQYMNQTLISAESLSKMKGDACFKCGHWMYERQYMTAPKKFVKETVNLPVTNTKPLTELRKPQEPPAKARKISPNEAKVIFHNDIPVRIKDCKPRSPSDFNRYIITNIPYFGYLGAFQAENSSILEVSWPFEKKVLEFENPDHARDFLQERFNQLLQPVPESFKIQVIVLIHLDLREHQPVNSDFLSGHCICGYFGTYNIKDLTEEFCQKTIKMSRHDILKLFAKRANEYVGKKIIELAQITGVQPDSSKSYNLELILDKTKEEIKYQQNRRIQMIAAIQSKENTTAKRVKKLFDMIKQLPPNERSIESRIFNDIMRLRPKRVTATETIEIDDDEVSSGDKIKELDTTDSYRIVRSTNSSSKRKTSTPVTQKRKIAKLELLGPTRSTSNSHSSMSSAYPSSTESGLVIEKINR